MAAFVGPKKDEPVSYMAPTPSAVRAMLEAIVWRPSIFWQVLRVYILNPIRWFTVRVNEVDGRAELGRVLVIEERRTQRTLVGLRDVDYIVEATCAWTPKRHPGEEEIKFISMFQNRLEKGQCHFTPYLGRRDFPASFEPAPEAFEPPSELKNRTLDLGMMLLDRHYGGQGNVVSEFFHAEIRNGVLVEKGKDTLPLFCPQPRD
jgi:CRISPR-associated protein Cas5d